VLAVPWTYALSSGRWALRFLSDWRWHHVRYTAPMVATVLPAGLIGYARLGRWLLGKRRGAWLLGGVWILLALGFAAAGADIAARLARVPRDIPADEVPAIWRWIREVGPEDGVVAAYEVAAPLSSRRDLTFNRLDLQKPPGYPEALGPGIRWAFLRTGDLDPAVLSAQGFEVVHRGDALIIFRRDPAGSSKPEASP